MRSSILQDKINDTFRLNSLLSEEKLPVLRKSYLKGKQNQLKKILNNQKNQINFTYQRKDIKKDRFANRFIKKNSAVQDNIRKPISKNSSFYKSIQKTSCSSFYRNSQIQSRLKPQQQKKVKKNSTFYKQSSGRMKMYPKTLSQIQKKVQSQFIIKQECFEIKKKCEIARRFKHLSLFPYKQIQIKQDEQILARPFKLSVFNLFQLKSYYNSLLKNSQGNVKRFKHLFQIMLNLANVTVRQAIVSQSIQQFIQQGVNFKNFVKAFNCILERLRKQTIIDYFQILLEDFANDNFFFIDFVKTLEGRMTKFQANELADVVFQKLNKQNTQFTNKKSILELCYTNQTFCNQVYALNNSNMIAMLSKDQIK